MEIPEAKVGNFTRMPVRISYYHCGELTKNLTYFFKIMYLK